MTNNNTPFVRAQCEGCTAPLTKTRTKGKYICEHCGAVYYDRNFQGDWEEEIVEPVVENPLPAELSFAPTYSIPHKKTALWVWLACGAALAGCLMLVLLSGLAGTSKAGKTTPAKAIEKPAMLNALPAAEKAGKAVAYANWEIAVDPNLKVSDGKIFIQFSVKNWSGSQQALDYVPKSIVVYDDLGNTYKVHPGNCEIDLPYLKRQVNFNAYETIQFSSDTSWCNSEKRIPAFFGMIPANAKHLYVHMEAFGVFKNITFVFDL